MSTPSRSLSELYIRDPFILPVTGDGLYFLYGTNSAMGESHPMKGFDVYRSRDLYHWEGPFPVFRPDAGFWGNSDFWAPEVYQWKGGYVMLASATRKNDGPYIRGVQLFRAASPLGPFVPEGNAPLTPLGDMCIDGTLHVDADQQPWLIYSHERMQTISGRVMAVRLAPDLSATIGKPITLFTGTDAKWNAPLVHKGQDTWCAEGAFVHRTVAGNLLLFWSGFLPGFNYVVAAARSRSGQITGPWDVDPEPMFSGNGGHGMSFKRFDGENIFVLHSPGFSNDKTERARLFKLEETGPRLIQYEK